MSPPIRVFLVDDQALIRSGLRMVLGSAPDLEVVGEAADGEEAVRRLGSLDADVVLVDVRMPGMNGVETTTALLSHADRPLPKVLVLTTFDVDDAAHAALRAGASGFLLKDTPPERLVEAVRTVHAGDAVIAPSTTRRLLSTLVPATTETTKAQRDRDVRARRLVGTLTPREREVLHLVAEGAANPEIAARLYVSDATVKTHVGKILAKLEARDRVHAVIAAYDAGLVGPGGTTHTSG